MRLSSLHMPLRMTFKSLHEMLPSTLSYCGVSTKVSLDFKELTSI